ncbi:MAG: hypothetical protein QGI11_01030, partial [Nitrospinota bacterium]|nr:hypothetical protein [Nitrospinota bacterium]
NGAYRRFLIQIKKQGLLKENPATLKKKPSPGTNFNAPEYTRCPNLLQAFVEPVPFTPTNRDDCIASY